MRVGELQVDEGSKGGREVWKEERERERERERGEEDRGEGNEL